MDPVNVILWAAAGWAWLLFVWGAVSTIENISGWINKQKRSFWLS